MRIFYDFIPGFVKQAYLLLLLFLSTSFFSVAQTSSPKELRFNHLFVEDGLRDGYITSLIQDKEGYIWAGTYNGLVRYDGYTPKIYNLGMDKTAIIIITNIFEDSKGTIWVGTELYGLFRYNRSTDRFTNYRHNPRDAQSLPKASISWIQDDKDGNIWIVQTNMTNDTSHITCLNVKSQKFTHYGDTEKGLQQLKGRLGKPIVDKKGRLLIGSYNGMLEFDPKNERFIHHLASSDTAQQKTLDYLNEDKLHPGVLWFRAVNMLTRKVEGLWRYDIDNKTLRKFRHDPKDKDGLPNDTVYSCEYDSKGRFWVGSFDGLSLFDAKTGKFLTFRPNGDKKLKHANAIMDIKADRYGNLWCQGDASLLLFNTQTLKFTRYKENIKDEYSFTGYVSNLMFDRAGTLWFTAQGGLQWINNYRSKFAWYRDRPGQPYHFPETRVYAFTELPDHTVVISTDNGLYRWATSGNTFKRLKLTQTKGMGHVHRLITDKKGLVWGAMEEDRNNRSGLLRYDPKSGNSKIYYPKKTKESGSSVANSVTAVFEDQFGSIWIGAGSNGIGLFNRETETFTYYTNYTNGNAIDDEIFNIYEDKQSNLWLSSWKGGLNKFDRSSKKFTSYRDQLPGSLVINGIFEDKQGRFWVGTYNAGLFLFDRKTGKAKSVTGKEGLLYDGESNILEDNRGNLWIGTQRGISVFNPKNNEAHTITVKNGLPEGKVSTSFKTSTGQMLFACKNGFFVLDPTDFIDSDPPIVQLETITFIPQTDGKTLLDSSLMAYNKSGIKLKYNENKVTFTYVGLHYQNAEAIRYAYKLDGFDKDWVQGGTQRSVTYPNLSPGTYIFHVKAANSNGIWSKKNISFTVTITSPWWATWWAWLLYAISFIIVIGTFVNYRTHRIKYHNKVLEEKVEHRTQQLNRSLDELKITQSQLIQSEKMASLGELTAGIAHEIQNPLNFVNNFAEVSMELIDEMKTEYESDNAIEAFAIAEEIKRNLEKISHHGERADSIVKGMLQHSRAGSSVKELTNINALADEYLRLAYHGLRAKDKDFNAELVTNFDPALPKIQVLPQDIGRVLLNLFNNAFYATHQKQKADAGNYKPKVEVDTLIKNNVIEIIVRDNGHGIPEAIKDKILQPFFTTKPTGEGTGLGLSLSYDIITKGHGGSIEINSVPGLLTEFIIRLPF